MGAGRLRGRRFEGAHMSYVYVSMASTPGSRCTGKCAEECGDSTGLVGVR